jgi:hypothetical protein
LGVNFLNCFFQNPLCIQFQLTGVPGTNQTVRFGIRKNNNGGSTNCQTALAAFLPTVNGLTPTCALRLGPDTTACAGGLATGYEGPLRYSASSAMFASTALILASLLLFI